VEDGPDDYKAAEGIAVAWVNEGKKGVRIGVKVVYDLEEEKDRIEELEPTLCTTPHTTPSSVNTIGAASMSTIPPPGYQYTLPPPAYKCQQRPPYSLPVASDYGAEPGPRAPRAIGDHPVSSPFGSGTDPD